MQSEKYIKETINLKTLTPVFIGGDQAKNLSQITDYLVRNGKVFIIDQRKFEKLLAKDNELIDEYVTLVKQRDSKFDLENFIENRLNSSVEELSKKEISVESYIERGEIKSFISSNGNTFIPGTSIKGSIRTSIIYNWLTSHHSGKNKINSVFNKLNQTKNEIDSLLRKKRERKLNPYEYRRLRELLSFKELIDEFHLFEPKEKIIKSNGDQYYKKYGHDFRHIQVSDSNFINDADTKIIQTYRKYLTKDSIKTSPWLHVMKENSETNFDIKLVNNFKDDFLKQLNNRDIKDLFKMINQFSIDFIEFELERFEEFIKNAKAAKKDIEETLQATITFYRGLKEKIKFAHNSVAILRIGGGKTYFDNSIGLALYKKDKDKFKQFRKLLGFWKHSGGWKAPFVEEDSPITRTFYYDRYSNQYLPIGWTVIYFEKDRKDIEKLFGTNEDKIKSQVNSNTNNNKNVDAGELDLSKLSNLGRVTTKRKT